MSDDRDFARNRAEEYGFDNWESFIKPIFFKEIEALRTNKPVIIEGGRGSGKTMLLRYWCHQTQFSKNRENIPNEAINKIGIYWKMDTQFAAFMQYRNKSEENWNLIFSYWSVLTISLSILDSLQSIADSKFKTFNKNDLQELDFEPLRGYDENIPTNYIDIKRYLKGRQQQFEIWVNSISAEVNFTFLPHDFIIDLVKIIKSNIIYKDTVFDIFIDEYENLQENQMRIINTWIKHSEIPIIYNIAMKRNALITTRTLGNECIVITNDYRKIQLDDLVEKNFDVFASEIFLWKLKKDKDIDTPVKKEDLFGFDNISFEKRQSKEYKSMLSKSMNEFFPSKTVKDIAQFMMQDDVFRRKINEELKHKHINKQEILYIMNDAKPECAIIYPSLINRNNYDQKYIFKELKNYNNGESHVFKNWIDNNLFGCILYLYGSVQRICPLYAGYKSFVTMSKDNLRHFLELCYQSFVKKGKDPQVDTQIQCLTVKMVSGEMVSEIKSLGRRSNELYRFAFRLGTFFEEARKKVSQSEPEQNQFNVNGEISQEAKSLLDELVKWSVLYESKLTKQKAEENGVEYLFNPIYAPYFGISYRKKRRIQFTSNDFNNLAFSESKKFQEFVSKKFNRNHGTENVIQQGFFDF